MAENSVKHADDEMIHIQELGKYLPDDYREAVMSIIRLSLIEAYRKGWKDAEKYFDESK